MFKPRQSTAPGFEPKAKTEAAKAVIRSLLDGRMLDSDTWTVSLVRRIGTEHAFLVIEGVLQDKKIMLRSDLFLNQNVSEIKKIPLVGTVFDRVLNFSKSVNSLAFISVKETTIEELTDLETYYHFQSWPLDLKLAQRLLEVLESWGNKTVTYHIAGNQSGYSVSTSTTKHHNCMSWCEQVLNDVNKDYFKLGTTWRAINIPSQRLIAIRDNNEESHNNNAK